MARRQIKAARLVVALTSGLKWMAECVILCAVSWSVHAGTPTPHCREIVNESLTSTVSGSAMA